MAIREYRDLVLIADEVQKDENGLVAKFTVSVFDSPVGQGEKKEIVHVPDGLTKEIGWLAERWLDKDVSRQIALGEMLAGLLLPPYARQLFRESLRRLPDGDGLRLRLRLADDLADFPWEYLYIQDSRGARDVSSFLALDPRISIVRHEALALPGDWFEAPNSRRVVMAMATPKPYDRYRKLVNLPIEQDLLKAALKDVPGITPIFQPEYAAGQAEDFPSTTLRDLLTALMERTDIFHFSGHGEFTTEPEPAFGSQPGEGAIILADERDEALPVSAHRLGEVLRGKGVRLVVLGACETGRRDGKNVWSGVVASLLKAGIPAVVAMQFTIQDTLAATFSAAFYRALVAGFLIDEAVAAGRAAMRAEALNGQRDIRDWGVPVLYLRAPGGRVFNPVSNEHAHQAAEKKVTQLFEQHLRTVPSTGRVIGAVAGVVQAGTVTVDQTSAERVSGVVIGHYTVSFQGGQLIVRQQADVVDGVLIGGAFDTIGGSSSLDVSQAQAIARLQELLRVEVPGTPASPKSCARCGVELPAGGRFCTRCGTRVGSP
jgi:hypothetical protein